MPSAGVAKRAARCMNCQPATRNIAPNTTISTSLVTLTKCRVRGRIMLRNMSTLTCSSRASRAGTPMKMTVRPA